MDLKPLSPPVLRFQEQFGLTVLVKALCGNSLWLLIRVALLCPQGFACVVYAQHTAPALTNTTCPRTGWPLSHLPYRTGQITTWLDVGWPQFHVTWERQGSCSVLTLNTSPGPASTTALWALWPLTQDPFSSSKRQDYMWRKASLCIWLAKRKVPGKVEGVFNPGWWGVTCCWQKLDGDGLLKYLEAEKPLQGSGWTTVSEDGTVHWNVLFSRGNWEIPIKNVGFVFAFYCQVVTIMLDGMVATLLNVNVGGPSRNGNYVIVSKAVEMLYNVLKTFISLY